MEQEKLLSMKIVVDKNSSKHVKACNMHSGKIFVKACNMHSGKILVKL